MARSKVEACYNRIELALGELTRAFAELRKVEVPKKDPVSEMNDDEYKAYLAEKTK